MMPPSPLVRSLAAPTFVRRLAPALVYLVFAGFAVAQDAPLKVAVYDVPPYGHVEPDGSIDGLSVDLWRRAAESLGREYHLVPVTQMEDILKGLERKDDEEGEAGLLDRRLGKASGRRVPADRAEEVERLYRERYQGFTVKHFHEHLIKDHG